MIEKSKTLLLGSFFHAHGVELKVHNLVLEVFGEHTLGNKERWLQTYTKTEWKTSTTGESCAQVCL